jgi:hypothetical protein
VLWPCPQIIRPDWKGFTRANPLDYRASSSVMKEKSFITWTPGGNRIKLFSPSLMKRPNKPIALFHGKPFWPSQIFAGKARSLP